MGHVLNGRVWDYLIVAANLCPYHSILRHVGPIVVALYVSRRRSLDYEPFNKYPGAYHYPDNAMAKVYRMSYAPHPLLMEVVERGGDIPPSLSAFDRCYLYNHLYIGQ